MCNSTSPLTRLQFDEPITLFTSGNDYLQSRGTGNSRRRNVDGFTRRIQFTLETKGSIRQQTSVVRKRSFHIPNRK